MFVVRGNFASCRSCRVAVTCLASINNHHGFAKQWAYVEREKQLVSENIDNDDVIVAFRAANLNSSIGRHSALFRSEVLQRCQLGSIRAYSMDAPSKVNDFGDLGNRHFEKVEINENEKKKEKFVSMDASSKIDDFGDLGNRHFEKVEMDEGEKKEEEFVENEARVFRRYRLTPGGYANLIKSHIQKRDLNSALKVLDTVRNNRDKPTTYMYNLLLRAHATVGDFKKSRSLYAAMKKQGLPCNAATYTSILNACANYHHTQTALDYLAELRQEFMTKNIVLNDTHYNAMIKAYGRHNQLLEAFKIADEMRDKKLATTIITFNSLLIGAISDREAGLRHALAVWHMMKRHRITPTIATYNLLLRAIRDTRFGNLKVNDFLLGSLPQFQITLNEETRPDLLNFPPSVNTLIMSIGEQSEKIDKDKLVVPANQSDTLPATVDTNSEENSLTPHQNPLVEFPLYKIHQKNKLILFGGVTGILERMTGDGAKPDTKTMTLLMELMPKSAALEKNIIKIARTQGVPLDIDFYNMLMKKKTLRKDYAGAKEVLDDIQRCGLCPDIVTWGILAMGCENSEDARTLIEGMDITGHRLNPVIAGTLINVACRKIRFGFILEIMEVMVRNHIKPNYELYTTLDAFQKEMEEMIKSKKFAHTVNNPAFKIGFSKFNLRYSTWQQHMGRKLENKGKKT